VTGTGTSNALLAAAACAVLAAAGCGSSGNAPGTATRVTAVAPADAGGLAAIRPRRAPASWHLQRTSGGASLFYPPGWTVAHGDPGTATAEALGAGGQIVSYLNVTPRQGGETLSGWAGFRVRHNIEEGERGVRTERSRTGVRFRDGVGSCVRDSYRTVTGSRYVEIACLVQGALTSSVIVAAARPGAWSSAAPALERSLSALLT
jgi:hypothetical protein